ncbi:unnamed protein product [Ciceribacter selenitireducens ATCC BAA-1503]|uniref:Uncharacterized protein n=1 Tax=Ciceribacter selenitireducens ATCC BAA-1503 TaxID=1336235 RepID=A0A376ACG8_9HYPH|nr:unnamed protein product [Ciceribacter selenitireducens ATCC BAA-1503]
MLFPLLETESRKTKKRRSVDASAGKEEPRTAKTLRRRCLM